MCPVCLKIIQNKEYQKWAEKYYHLQLLGCSFKCKNCHEKLTIIEKRIEKIVGGDHIVELVPKHYFTYNMRIGALSLVGPENEFGTLALI